MSAPPTPTPPTVPGWVRWTLRRLLDEREVRLVLDELAELHAALAARHGKAVADRRYRSQLRKYPLHLAAGKLRASVSSASPGVGEAGRAVRSLLHVPGLTATIVLTVGIGIGGCATIFSLVDTLWLRPLPYPDANRLEWIFTDAPPNRFPLSVVDYQALEAQQTVFSSVAAAGSSGQALRTDQGVELIQVLQGTPDLLQTWGLAPLLGRTATPDEAVPGAPGTALVTPGFAARWLGTTDPATALGRTLELDDEPYQVIGILPPTLGPLARGREVLTTLRLEPPTRKGPFFLQVYGRLRPGVTSEEATRELRTLNTRLFPLWADSYQDRNASWGVVSAPERVRAGAGPLLAILMAAVGMVLLIALSNAANLLLARVSGRGRELAIRSSLGASRGRIWSHLMTESALLAAGGAALGLALAQGGVALLPVVASSWLPRTGEASLTSHTVLFALLLAVAAGAVFAVVPAMHRKRDQDLAGALRAGGRSATGNRSRQRSQRLLVGGQLAVVVPLLAGAALLLSSFVRLQRVDPGFDAEHTLSMGVMLSPTAYADAAARERFWRPALDDIGALPGVAGAALASERPPVNVNNINNFDLEDRPTPPGEPQRIAPWIVVGPSFFEVMGVPLVEGRGFRRTDLDPDAPPVVLVDEAWARRNYPGESPVGRRLYSGGATSGPRTTIVGVVGTVPYMGVGTSDLGAVYAPEGDDFAQAWLLVRTTGDPHAAAGSVRDVLRRLDPSVPVVMMASGEELLHDSLTRPRHLSLLLAVFSAVALALAVVGVYGITSYSVQQRRGDIAIRLALGGAPASVLRRVFWEGMRVSLMGLAAGAIVALAVTGTLSGLLYGVAPRDPRTLGAAAAVLLGVSAVACLFPALRAVGVAPSEALREE